MKETSIAFISEKIKAEFDKLGKGKFEEKKLYSFIQRAIEDLKQCPSSGTKIPKDIWPEKYIKDYGITNLWK